MTGVSLANLSELTGGTLNLGAMPPLDGALATLGRVVIDSREVEPGDVFWALPGTQHDGQEFAAEAFARGAIGVVLSDQQAEPWAGCFTLNVPDTQLALWDLARHKRSTFAGTSVAVTGSVGKTTTREMIRTVLKSRFTGTASPRNYNNNIGLPLSLLQVDPTDDYAVFEIGANHPGEVESLASLCQPEIGVLTELGDAHLGAFGGRAALNSAKGELLSTLADSGWAVLCGDDLAQRQLAKQTTANTLFYGRDASCDVAATKVQAVDGQLQFCVDGVDFQINCWGRHHLMCALAAVGVGQLFGMKLPEIAEALAAFETVPMRCQMLQVRGVHLINDTYNASPKAMRAALELLYEYDAVGKKIAVVGDMGELGSQAEAFHRRLGREVVTHGGADVLIACGEFAQVIAGGAVEAGMPGQRAVAVANPLDVAGQLEKIMKAGDAVLVKGSRKLQLERVIESLQQEEAKSPLASVGGIS